ncbi:EpsG family protein [Escherichia coli]|uniref:EpsG family protein n=1 Tax=Escherichia coli TaxID=562 RepID=UPI003890344D
MLFITPAYIFFIQKNKFNTDTIVSFYLSHAFIVRDLIEIRAGLAVSISLYSIIKFKGNKSIITGVLFASLIHSGALIIALCYPFSKKNT